MWIFSPVSLFRYQFDFTELQALSLVFFSSFLLFTTCRPKKHWRDLNIAFVSAASRRRSRSHGASSRACDHEGLKAKLKQTPESVRPLSRNSGGPVVSRWLEGGAPIPLPVSPKSRRENFSLSSDIKLAVNGKTKNTFTVYLSNKTCGSDSAAVSGSLRLAAHIAGTLRQPSCFTLATVRFAARCVCDSAVSGLLRSDPL